MNNPKDEPTAKTRIETNISMFHTSFIEENENKMINILKKFINKWGDTKFSVYYNYKNEKYFIFPIDKVQNNYGTNNFNNNYHYKRNINSKGNVKNIGLNIKSNINKEIKYYTHRKNIPKFPTIHKSETINLLISGINVYHIFAFLNKPNILIKIIQFGSQIDSKITKEYIKTKLDEKAVLPQINFLEIASMMNNILFIQYYIYLYKEILFETLNNMYSISITFNNTEITTFINKYKEKKHSNKIFLENKFNINKQIIANIIILKNIFEKNQNTSSNTTPKNLQINTTYSTSDSVEVCQNPNATDFIPSPLNENEIPLPSPPPKRAPILCKSPQNVLNLFGKKKNVE